MDDINEIDVDKLGRELSEHPLFPEQANIGFMQILSNHHIKLRVYERGCGETQACGSGAVAAGAVARLYYEADNPVKVSLPGGDLSISWPGTEEVIYLKGPAEFVYEGTLLP